MRRGEGVRCLEVEEDVKLVMTSGRSIHAVLKV